MSSKARLEQLLEGTGVQFNGPNPWDPQVKNDGFYSRVLGRGSLGAGESYMDEWWEVDDLAELAHRIMRARLDRQFITPALVWTGLVAYLINLQSRTRAFQIGERHYDIGNELYQKMLDTRMTYTCGYWSGTPTARSLDEAQEAKLDLVCKKIGLTKGMTVLDIGCGWGSFARFAAEKYGATVTGVTVAKEQVELAKKLCEGLPVTILLQDYREIQGQFDRVVSLGMFEHVGRKNYREYMQVVRRVLAPDGFFLLHTIGANKSTLSMDPWVAKYIFPNSMLPSIKQIGKSIEGIFVMDDWHNFGADYDKTLNEWWKNFDRAWPQLKEKYGERFYRMWKFYLLMSAGNFRARNIQLWQIVLSQKGVAGGYTSVR